MGKQCVEIRAWLPEKDNFKDSGSSSEPAFGHVALRTYTEEENGDISEGVYVSFWPGNCCVCKESKDHFHTKDQDDLWYGKEPENPPPIKLYTLDVNSIERKFQEFKNSNFHWKIAGSLLTLEREDTKTCAGLCFTLLEAGGLFSRLGHQNNARGIYFPQKETAICIRAGCILLFTAIITGAITIKVLAESSDNLAAVVVGSSMVLLEVFLTKWPAPERIITPEVISGFGKKIHKVESTLFSSDIPIFENKISREILRLRNTKVLSFFQDPSAQNKAIHIEAALLRAKKASGLITVADYLFYSYKGMASIFQEVSELRNLSTLSRPTTTFKNLMGLGDNPGNNASQSVNVSTEIATDSIAIEEEPKSYTLNFKL